MSPGTTAAFRRGKEAVADDARRALVELPFRPRPGMKLLYLPAEIAWVNRSADLLEVTGAGAVVDVLGHLGRDAAAGRFTGSVEPGGARRRPPLPGRLPAWVENAYLQSPGISAAHRSTGAQITVHRQPYDQAGDHGVAGRTWSMRGSTGPPPGGIRSTGSFRCTPPVSATTPAPPS
jgi:hypothetical protein